MGGDSITKKDLEQILDVKFGEYQGAIVEAVGHKFQSLELRMDLFEKKIDRLAGLLEDFLKRLTEHEDEFKILRAEVDKMKSVFKEKLGVEISIYE